MKFMIAVIGLSMFGVTSAFAYDFKQQEKDERFMENILRHQEGKPSLRPDEKTSEQFLRDLKDAQEKQNNGEPAEKKEEHHDDDEIIEI